MSFSSKKGYTLIELVVAMGIFALVSVIVGSCFSTLLRYSSRFMKSEESNIEGNIALELMRHDISSAGFGLPTSYNISGKPTYSEAANTPAKSLNDAPSGIPRAVAGTFNLGANADTGTDNVSYTTLAGSDYLALKATSLGTQPAAQKWTYVNYTSKPPKTPKVWTSGNLSAGDRVIALDRSASSADGGYDLLKDTQTGNYWTTYDPSGVGAGFSPKTAQETVYLYGVSSSDLVMPFNRADYFVAKPGTAGLLPNYCAPNTGILYRGMVKHSAGGKIDYQPVMDCVAAMHVVLGWNMLDSTGSVVTDTTKTGSGAVDTWSNLDGTNSWTTSPLPIDMTKIVTDPGQVRSKLKVVKVYILAQKGKKDPAYTSPTPIKMYSDEEGITPLGAAAYYALPPEMQNYRWNVYKLVIRPKNLLSNQ